MLRLSSRQPLIVVSLCLVLNLIVDKGRSAFLLKPSSKHKRKRNEMEEVKDEEELLKRDKQNYLLEVKKLKKNANSVMEGTSGMG